MQCLCVGIDDFTSLWTNGERACDAEREKEPVCDVEVLYSRLCCHDRILIVLKSACTPSLTISKVRGD